jgi:UDP-N-acetylmuramate--alanine ligase
MVVACNDDLPLRRLFPQIQRRLITYGARRGSDFQIKLEKPKRSQDQKSRVSRFHVTYREESLGDFELHVPGVHNILNATAAIAVGVGLDVSVEQIQSALASFAGVDRRFQLRGTAAGVSVIDDYGHHPTEIRATLAAARECGYRKVHVVFQPHRYTRTQSLMDEFATAFENADSLFVLDIYPAGEQAIEGISAEALARRICEKGITARYVSSFEDAAAAVTTGVEEGDMILTLGAGSVSQLGPIILERLQTRIVDVPGSVAISQ